MDMWSFVVNTKYFLHKMVFPILIWTAKHFPLQNKVVFCNYFGKGFADDPKYIALAMLRQGTTAKLYWMTKDLSIDLPAGIVPIRYESTVATWHLHTAKIWVYNYKNAFKVEKREEQYYIQTWHGSFALKKVERDTEETLSAEYLSQTKKDSAMIDLMYSNNEFKRNLFRHSFWYDGKVIKSDSPQLSVLFNTPKDLKQRICSLLHIPQGKKIVLYSPSFREEPDVDLFSFDHVKVLKALEYKFQIEFQILFRLHPNNEYLSAEMIDIGWIDVTNYPDMDELMAISDVMITDFSGVAFDMAIKRAPVFLFAKDFDHYICDERELYMPVDDTPFSIATDEDTLCENIISFDETKYLNDVASFFARIGLEENGNGDEYIASIIQQKLIE